METDQTLGVLELGANLIDGQARGVGGQNRVFCDELFNVGKNILLDAEFFKDCFDNPVSIGEGSRVGRSAHQCLEALVFIRGDATLVMHRLNFSMDVGQSLV